MRKCVECRSTDIRQTRELLPFNDVALVEGTLHRCHGCGATYHELSRVEELSQTIARAIARQDERLLPEQIRFLRKYLGYSSKDFAAFLAVTPDRLPLGEPTHPMVMQLSTEKLIRLMALTEHPIASYGLDHIGAAPGGAAPKPLLRERAGHWHLDDVGPR